MNNIKSYLSLEEINNILPFDLHLDIDRRVERGLYKANNGELIAVSNSKLYTQDRLWYSFTTDYFANLGVKKVCFVAANFGVLIIPIQMLKEYNKCSGWKELNKGRSYYIRMRIVNNEYFFVCSDSPTMHMKNITEFFIPLK